MTQDDVIEMARQAGFTEIEFYGNKVGTNVTKCLEAFAKLVEARASAKEREACASFIEELDERGFKELAELIRARGK